MRQSRWWLPAALLLCAAPARAQVQTVEAAEAAQGHPAAVTKIKVHPAAAPQPALKYRLLPEARELKQGNAVVLYYRSFAPEWQISGKQYSDVWKHIEKWQDDPAKPPHKDLRFVLHHKALDEIDAAARRTYCDWEMLDRLRKEGIGLLLPDVQGFRNSAQYLVLRARFQTLDKHYDKAVYTLQTGLQFGRHISDGPTLIQSLVGNAISAIMLSEVEFLIQQPGAPNLYWALTDLPRPFIDLKKPLEGERILIDNLFPGWREMLKDPEARPLSQQEIDAFMDKTVDILKSFNLQQVSGEKETFASRAVLAVMAAASYPDARKFLLDHGHPKKLVDQMPVSQVAMLYEVATYDRFYDDMVKWYGLPYSEMAKGVAKVEKQLKQAKADAKPGAYLATLLLPAVQKVFHAGYRTDRKIAVLRCVEAIRLYAAGHGGKLPAKLQDIHEVPVPDDPFTGGPFQYQVEGDTAKLTAPVAAGEYPIPGYNGVFEITIQP